MEPQAVVKIVSDLARCPNEIFVSHLIIDDDTTTMAQLRNKANGGYLDDDIRKPEKWADLGHRIRSFARQTNELANMGTKESRVNKKISMRCNNNSLTSCDIIKKKVLT